MESIVTYLAGLPLGLVVLFAVFIDKMWVKIMFTAIGGAFLLLQIASSIILYNVYWR